MQSNLPLPQEVTEKELESCGSFKDSLRLAYKKSGKSYKVLALELQERGHTIDESTLSLSLSETPSQKKNFPSEAVDDFMSLTSNIPLRYLALKNGCGLVRLKSVIEHENEMLKAQLAEKEKELQVITDFMKKIK